MKIIEFTLNSGANFKLNYDALDLDMCKEIFNIIDKENKVYTQKLIEQNKN